MKTTNRLLILITIVFFAFSITSCKCQNDDFTGEKITITLYVNTDSIVKPNINRYSSFGQDTTQISNEDYTVVAKVGDSITWVGVSTTDPNNDEVKIKKIKRKGGPKVFKKGSMDGNKKVKGKVRKDTEGQPDYKYEIQFTVFNNGNQRNGTFKIDPKIQVNK